MTQHRVCDQCPGLKLIVETEELDLEIEPGMVDGMTQKFSGTINFYDAVNPEFNIPFQSSAIRITPAFH